MAFKFEKLLVWQKTLSLCELIDQVTKKFPKEEIYILASQIKRAADSVALNIVEGSTGQSNPEQVKFLKYAIRSNIEVVGCIFIARKRKIILDLDFESVYQLCEEILAMLYSFKRKLETQN